MNLQQTHFIPNMDSVHFIQVDLYCYIKVLKVKPVYQQMTLSPKLGVVEISTLWHFRLPLLIQMFIKVVSSPRLSGIWMPSPILWSHLLKMQRIVLLSSLLWWELGTNSLVTGPGEWLLFRRFTSRLSWSWNQKTHKTPKGRPEPNSPTQRWVNVHTIFQRNKT